MIVKSVCDKDRARDYARQKKITKKLNFQRFTENAIQLLYCVLSFKAIKFGMLLA